MSQRQTTLRPPHESLKERNLPRAESRNSEIALTRLESSLHGTRHTWRDYDRSTIYSERDLTASGIDKDEEISKCQQCLRSIRYSIR